MGATVARSLAVALPHPGPRLGRERSTRRHGCYMATHYIVSPYIDFSIPGSVVPKVKLHGAHATRRRLLGETWLPARVALFASIVVAGPGIAAAQQVVALDPEQPDPGRLILSRGMADAHPSCPVSALQFGLDPEDDPAWSSAQGAGWDPDEVIPVVRGAMARARAALPGPAIDLCLGLSGRPTNPTLARMNGIGGAAFPPATMMLVVAPALNPDWLERLPFTIAHEYHHLATTRPAPTGLEVLIREGRAHHFAWQLYPQTLHPSAMALTAEQIGPAWRTIRDNLTMPSGPFLRRYMFAGTFYGGEVPGWAGYTIGFCLVWAHAEARPGVAPLDLARVPARDFVTNEARCPADAVSGGRRPR